MNDEPNGRRQFLKSLGLAAAGAATLNVDAAAPMGRGDVRRWDLETDLLIVGSGVAGVSAAIEARRSGIAALMLERQHLPGG